ncbi:MAG: ribonuclease H-like domain-containing protein [Spirochaetaceae bacterium]|jgi:uncharacterized protein YprB with RNaseH-like and TPR domain|nr:ribonuclease H-like domain-containing protein [Spirochaetaceae bacterium]
MPGTLANRLRLIRETGGAEGERRDSPAGKTVFRAGDGESAARALPEALNAGGWVSTGFFSARRTVTRDSDPRYRQAMPPPGTPFPRVLPVLVPGVFRYLAVPAARGELYAEDLLFFDLETSGLSTAAGTVAFLAAFGRFVPDAGEGREKGWRFRIDQHIMLDFPGENDFLAAALHELYGAREGRPPLLVTYNGKTFDLPIMRNRALFSGIFLPEPCHADLLHPARRLWRRMLPSCSQRVIEEEILGLDREGDVPGAEAPDIWFQFLKTGAADRLCLVADHNLRDIAGLAVLFTAFADIAARPLAAPERYRCDPEALALCWRRSRRQEGFTVDGTDRETENALMENAARSGWPRAVTILAIEAEWRERNAVKALALVERTLARDGIGGAFRESLLCRRERLLRKTRRGG